MPVYDPTIWDDELTDEFLSAVLSLDNKSAAKAFLADVLTNSEITEFSKRLRTAKMLKNGDSYDSIREATGMSTTTIARVSDWLKKGAGGYNLVIRHLGEMRDGGVVFGGSSNEPNLKIGIQKKGRLRTDSEKFLKSIDWEVPADNVLLGKSPTDSNVEIAFGRQSDLPDLVAAGIIDAAIVGMNVIREKNDRFEIVRELAFGNCSLYIAVPESASEDLSTLNNKRIVTSYPRSLRKFLAKNDIRAHILTLSGSVELAPSLGAADAICDIVQTGKTLKANGLKKTAKVYDSQAVLITRPSLPTEQKSKLLESVNNANF